MANTSSAVKIASICGKQKKKSRQHGLRFFFSVQNTTTHKDTTGHGSSFRECSPHIECRWKEHGYNVGGENRPDELRSDQQEASGDADGFHHDHGERYRWVEAANFIFLSATESLIINIFLGEN